MARKKRILKAFFSLVLPLGALYHLSERIVERKSIVREESQNKKMGSAEYRVYKELNSSYQKTFLQTLTPDERKSAISAIKKGVSPERAIDDQLDQRVY